jgi:hypothetical protein
MTETNECKEWNDSNGSHIRWVDNRRSLKLWQELQAITRFNINSLKRGYQFELAGDDVQSIKTPDGEIIHFDNIEKNK